MGDEKKKEEVDSRLDYLCTFVTKTFRVKQEKWQKLLSTDDKVISGIF